ncbi:hypothetical protein C2S51_037184 [Perilla frutescens var. frutescens]|nr:hypothetical protein C2S51_037184 [Perilla frutescens var. frutescens]
MVGDNWYFKDGWTKFIEDNMIEGGDMLVYEYSSRGLLDFKLHGRSNCLTRGVGGHRTMDYCEGEQVLDDDVHSIPTTEEGNESFELFEEEMTDDDTEDDDYLPTTTEEDQREACPNEKEAMNDVNQERTQEEGRRDDSIPEVQVRDDGGSSTSKRKSTRDFDGYGVEIFQSRLVHQPNNPYFVTKKRKQRAYELYMPMDVIKRYGLQLPETIVKDEDTCICEFIPRGQDLCIHVSFFPPKH